MEQLAGSLPSSLLSTLLALAATFLGLAAAVQVLQEFYKYLSWSEARVYRKVLVDFAGPWIEKIFEPGTVQDLAVRGPFQFRALRPPRVLLPLAQDELREALERLAPEPVREVAEQLRRERDVQTASGLAIWSPSWEDLVEKLRRAATGGAESVQAAEVLSFFDRWVQPGGGSPRADARTVLVAFEQRFLAEAVRLERLFPRLERNLGYANRRRNLRHTFTIAFLLVLLFDLPFDGLYRSAAGASLEESVALAEARIDAYEALSERGAAGASEVTREQLEGQLQALLVKPGESSSSGRLLGRVRDRLGELGEDGIIALPGHLFFCLITAFLVSFGAPLWHNLTGALWRAGRARLGKPAEEAGASG